MALNEIQKGGYNNHTRITKWESGMLVMKKIDGKYIAIVGPNYADAFWMTDKPISEDELIDNLTGIGCHQTDIGDALDAAKKDKNGVGLLPGLSDEAYREAMSS